MKNKMLLIKSTIYPIIFALALLKIFFSTTFSFAESFDIKNVEISKQFNMSFQRKDALDEGFKIAYNNLILNITSSSQRSSLPQEVPKNTENLIQEAENYLLSLIMLLKMSILTFLIQKEHLSISI